MVARKRLDFFGGKKIQRWGRAGSFCVRTKKSGMLPTATTAYMEMARLYMVFGTA